MKHTAIAAMLLVCVSLSACAIPSVARRDPGTLVVLEAGDANTMNPLFANNEPSFLYYGLVLDSLANVGPNFTMIPWLATSWTSTPDRLHWTVQLRHGVRWSDGAPFTSKDVVWTWHAMLDPKTGYPYAGQFNYIKNVRALGPYAVQFDLSHTNALFVSGALDSPILPYHILGKTPDAQLRTSPFGQHPIGTGPYMLERWNHDAEAIFVANPHWWHGPVKIKRLEFRVVLDPNARDQAMENGSADLYDSMGSNDYVTLRKQAPQLRFVHLPDLYTWFIMVNLRTPGLRNERVRQAMMYGWDRQAVISGLLHKDAIEATGIVPVALHYWYDPNVRHYAYDPAKARALLDADGWRVGRDGIRSKDGVRLDYTLLASTGSHTIIDVCQEFQSDMRALGIRIHVKELDYATFIADSSDLHYQLAFTGWGGVTDPDEFTFFDSSQIVPIGNNETAYSNPTVDHDLQMGLRTITPAKRRPYYNQMQAITARQLPVLWGYYTYFRAAYVPALHIDRQAALPDLYFWYDVWNWRLDR